MVHTPRGRAVYQNAHVQEMREVAPRHPEERSNEAWLPRAEIPVRSPKTSAQKKRARPAALPFSTCTLRRRTP